MTGKNKATAVDSAKNGRQRISEAISNNKNRIETKLIG